MLPSPNEIHFPSPLEAAKVVSLKPSELSSRLTPYSMSVCGTAAMSALIVAWMPDVVVTQVAAAVVPD